MTALFASVGRGCCVAPGDAISRDFGSSAVKLRAAKFNNVSELFLYVEREAADVVALSKLAFTGSTVEGTNVAAIKKIGEDPSS